MGKITGFLDYERKTGKALPPKDTQPADHPVNIYHPEGEYLKGLVLYVE